MPSSSKPLDGLKVLEARILKGLGFKVCGLGLVSGLGSWRGEGLGFGGLGVRGFVFGRGGRGIKPCLGMGHGGAYP